MFVDFAELKASTSIEQVFPMLDLDLIQKGDQWRGSCPACDGGDRSLVVTGSKQAWYCFGCKKGGDLISLVAAIRGLSIKDAALAIAEHLGTVPVQGTGTSSQGTVPARSGKEDARSLQPLSYLEPAHKLVEELGLSEATCDHFGAGYAPKGILRGRLAIPIHSLTGELVAYCGRSVKSDQKPILTFPKGFDPTAYVFNLHRAGEGELYCSNDPFEVLLAYEQGIENCIAFLHRASENVVVPFPKTA